jgi:hypothetical protein
LPAIFYPRVLKLGLLLGGFQRLEPILLEWYPVFITTAEQEGEASF